MTNKLKYSRPWSVLRYMLPVTNSTVQGYVETILTQEQWDELMGSEIVARIFYILPTTADGTVRDVWLMEQLKALRVVTDYDIVYERKARSGRRSGRGYK